MKGKVIKYEQDNIDTDVILPGPYLKLHEHSELAEHAMEGMDPDFHSKVKNASIIVTGNNFGCGSSREHAVWAIKDFGIEAVISSSFAEIFSNNSFKNQLLLAPIKKSEIDWLFEQIPDSGIYQLTIDILNQTISTPDNVTINFAIDQSNKEKVIHGYDDIELTLKNKKVIKDFEKTIKNKKT